MPGRISITEIGIELAFVPLIVSIRLIEILGGGWFRSASGATWLRSTTRVRLGSVNVFVNATKMMTKVGYIP